MYIPVTFTTTIKPRDTEIAPTTFSALSLQERHLEEYIRQNVGDILPDETLLVVGQQVRNQSRGISDLTAVDGEGNIVLIEIKRDLDDITHRSEAFEMQAIRYAASYAKIKTPEELVDLVFADYIERHRSEFDLGPLTPAERARRNLNQFLTSNDALRTFNRQQRVILIASAFDDQTLSAVAWLIHNKVAISCIAITPVFINGEGFLKIEQLLPPPLLDDFYVDLAASAEMPAKRAGSTSSTPRTYLPRMDKLFEWGIVRPGDQLSIKGYKDSTAELIDYRHVRYKEEEMSPFAWGKLITGWSSINIYEWAVLDRVGETLDKLRLEELDRRSGSGTSSEA